MGIAPLVIETNPAEEDLRFLEDQINQHNMAVTGYKDYQPLAGFVRDEGGAVIAGLSGYTWGGFCEIEFLWVHPDCRGKSLGRRLLAGAETEAARRGCTVVVLDSYSFQAPDFYRKLGYTVIGIYEGVPVKHRRVHLEKRL